MFQLQAGVALVKNAILGQLSWHSHATHPQATFVIHDLIDSHCFANYRIKCQNHLL